MLSVFKTLLLLSILLVFTAQASFFTIHEAAHSAQHATQKSDVKQIENSQLECGFCIASQLSSSTLVKALLIAFATVFLFLLKVKSVSSVASMYLRFSLARAPPFAI